MKEDIESEESVINYQHLNFRRAKCTKESEEFRATCNQYPSTKVLDFLIYMEVALGIELFISNVNIDILVSTTETEQHINIFFSLGLETYLYSLRRMGHTIASRIDYMFIKCTLHIDIGVAVFLSGLTTTSGSSNYRSF